jgi:hypothetical protein
MKLQNPLVALDDFLLDYVFNPFSWWAEYNFGKDAMFFRVQSRMLGCIMFMAIGLWMYDILLFFLAFSLSVLTFLFKDVVVMRWNNNNSTGRNVARVADRSFRYFDTFGCIFIALSYKNQSMMMSFVSIVAIMGALFAFWVTSYLDATDKMPPMYGRLKTVGQN